MALALGRIPSGLFILTAGFEPGPDRAADAREAGLPATPTGMLVSFVQQIGLEPPVVSVAMGHERWTTDLVRRTGVFCLSVLDAESSGLLKHFARGFEPGQTAFDGLETAVSADGVPYPVAACAHLECRVVGEARWSDHTLIAAEVVAGDLGHAESERTPSIHLRRNGLSY